MIILCTIATLSLLFPQTTVHKRDHRHLETYYILPQVIIMLINFVLQFQCSVINYTELDLPPNKKSRVECDESAGMPTSSYTLTSHVSPPHLPDTPLEAVQEGMLA